MRINPNQKLGMETPKSATSMLNVSTQVFCRSAEIVPSTTPIVTAMTIATNASWIVDPACSPIISSTGRWLWTDSPKSPCSTRPM